MLTEDLVDVPVDVFGGYCPAIVPANLPPGAANVAQDVQFPEAGVRTRGGLAAYVFNGAGSAQITAGASINGLKTYLTASGGQRLLIWDSLGEMFKENPQGTLDLINSRPYTGLFYESQTLFGREYQAFSNALGGFDIPRQFDDVNWDRVSQCGPAVAPVVASYVPPVATLAGASGAAVNIVASPAGIVWGGLETIYIDGGRIQIRLYTYFTVTTTTPHGLVGNQGITIAGASENNGNFVVQAVTGATTFKVAAGSGFPATNGGGGTVTPLNAVLTRQNNVATANTAAPHGFLAGFQVQIAGVTPTAIGGGISAISRSGAGVVTVTTTTPHGLVPDSTVFITGVTNPDTSFVGIFSVATVLSPTQFTYIQTGTAENSTAGTGNVEDVWNTIAVITSVPSATTFTYGNIGPNDSTASGGTATIVPQMLAGLHQVSVAYITRQGFITPAAPPTSFYASGSGLAALSQISTGPPNITARLLIFTTAISAPATTGPFYSITSSMLIPDNITTAALIDFNEAILASSFSADYLFSEIELGESAFFLPYNSRAVWLGERAKQTNILNFTFDGGFSTTNANFPDGWTPDPNNGVGGNSALASGNPTDWGDAYVILGDGATAVRGLITQSVYQDFLGVAIIAANTSYSVRVRVASVGGFNQGTVHINLQSTLQAFTTPGLAIAAAAVVANNGKFAEFTAQLTAAPLAVPPSDLVIQVYVDGTPANLSGVVIDSIEIFPTNAPFSSSVARISYAFNPEGFDDVTGQVQVRPGDGQTLRAGFPLRNSLYLAKDHYLGYVTDDGINEPSSWQFTEVSATTGICGPNAVDWTEEWAVFAERSGLWICWGSDPVKITPEIQIDASFTGRTCWNSINWAAASTIWVRIDRINKMILIGAPINGATTPNIVFMMDYRWLDSAEDIASSGLVNYSAFTGKMLAHGRGRRWALWSIKANSMCFAERADGTSQPFFGNGSNNATLYEQLDVAVQPSDNGVTIPWAYQTYACPSHQEEQQYQLRSHSKLAGYLKFRAWGSGTLNLAITTALRSTLLRGYTLSLNPAGDGERPLNLKGERFFINLSNSGVGTWVQIEKIILCVKKNATMLTRGVSS